MPIKFRNINVNTCSTAPGWTIAVCVSIHWRCTGGFVIVFWASCGVYGRYKGAIHTQFNRAILLSDVIPDGKTE